MPAEPSTVEFSVKELFLEVRNELKEISGKLDSKAEALDLLAVADRVTKLEKSALTQEAIESSANQARNTRLASYGAVITSLGVLIALLALVAG